MFNKKFEIQPKKFEIKQKKFELDKPSYGDSDLITKILPIEEGGINIEKENDLEDIVEAPLLDACKLLYGKRIETVFSSANQKDILDGYAYIVVDLEKLSEENKQIALAIGELGRIHGSIERKGIYIKIPITENSTVGEIKEESIKIAQQFKQQL
jgi:hypothetical protein